MPKAKPAHYAKVFCRSGVVNCRVVGKSLAARRVETEGLDAKHNIDGREAMPRIDLKLTMRQKIKNTSWLFRKNVDNFIKKDAHRAASGKKSSN